MVVIENGRPARNRSDRKARCAQLQGSLPQRMADANSQKLARGFCWRREARGLAPLGSGPTGFTASPDWNASARNLRTKSTSMAVHVPSQRGSRARSTPRPLDAASLPSNRESLASKDFALPTGSITATPQALGDDRLAIPIWSDESSRQRRGAAHPWKDLPIQFHRGPRRRKTSETQPRTWQVAIATTVPNVSPIETARHAQKPIRKTRSSIHGLPGKIRELWGFY